MFMMLVFNEITESRPEWPPADTEPGVLKPKARPFAELTSMVAVLVTGLLPEQGPVALTLVASSADFALPANALHTPPGPPKVGA
jgi:hypothetical protein